VTHHIFEKPPVGALKSKERSAIVLEWNELDDRAVDTARVLAADAVEASVTATPEQL
jgi:hypothetical protein